MNAATLTQPAVTHVAADQKPVERFDLNSVTLVGQVTRVMMRDDDIVARLRVSAPDERTHHFSILLPNGLPLQGDPVSLAPGRRVRVSGYVGRQEYYESLTRILTRAGHPAHARSGDEDLWLINSTTFVIAETIGLTAEADLNEAKLDGLVAATWGRRPRRETDAWGQTTLKEDRTRYAMLAVYDAWSKIIRAGEGAALPRRSPHYVMTIFPNGQTADGLDVRALLERRARLKVKAGHLISVDYRESITSLLKRGKHLERNEDRFADIRVGRSSVYLAPAYVDFLK